MSSFIIIGGDRRMLHAAERLGKAYVCGFKKLTPCIGISENGEGFSYAVLPPQKSPDGVNIFCPYSDILLPYTAVGKAVKTGGTVFTGHICEALSKVCADNGLRLVNYLEREELAVRNAVLTAEGALSNLINETETSVYGTEILITGFGRIAKILAKYLTAMSARVTVACRKKSNMEWAGIYGCKTVDITEAADFTEAVSQAEVILNTVPAAVFGEEEITAMRENALYMELASSDGISVEIPGKIRVITARGLPGKTASVTAGHIIADAIQNILSEEGS